VHEYAVHVDQTCGPLKMARIYGRNMFNSLNVEYCATTW
jgi:hypothetical protein